MAKPLAQKIVVLGTGGTIAGRAADAADNLGYTAAQVGVAQLLGSVPGLEQVLDRYQLATEQVAQVDSKDMGFAVWQQLALRCAHWLAQSQVRGVVITHGTDTLEETAFFLQSVLEPALTANKALVLTCAMRPASAHFPDGPQNLLDALALAADPGAQGVLAVCAGRIHSARHVQKVHPYRLDAFDSGESGPLGYVEGGKVRWVNAQLPTVAARAALGGPHLEGDGLTTQPALAIVAGLSHGPRVEIVMNHAGASGLMVDAMLAQPVDAVDRLRGLVVAATGNGTVHQDLEAALLRAQRAGVRVVLATRCPYGQVLPAAGALIPDSDGLTPPKARVALLLELSGISVRR